MAEYCKNCNAVWKPNDTGACSYCGHHNRITTLEVQDSLLTVSSTEVKLIPKTDFDLSVRHDGKTIIELSKTVEEDLISYFLRHPDELKIIDRRLFEKLVAEIYRGFGYEVELTQQTHDGGIDIIAIKRQHEARVKYLIECKRPDPGKSVSVKAVRELYGVKTDEKATKGIIVTTTFFSHDAKMFLEKHEWELDGKDYGDLSRWLEAFNEARRENERHFPD